MVNSLYPHSSRTFYHDEDKTIVSSDKLPRFTQVKLMAGNTILLHVLHIKMSNDDNTACIVANVIGLHKSIPLYNSYPR